VTAAQSKKDRIVHAVEELLNTIRIEEIPLRALIPSSKTFIGRKEFHRLEKSVDRHFDDVTLQELAQITETSIVKHPKEKVCIPD
jgi:DNA-binding IscR family transcriptional regulator